jgi:fructose-bisphosphate aldolase class I
MSLQRGQPDGQPEDRHARERKLAGSAKHAVRRRWMDLDAMRETARDLVAPGKGILAADESTPTIKKRFDQIGVESTEESRRQYRQLLFTTPELDGNISGVILYDETIRQTADDGSPFVEVLEKAGVIPGIKVDRGALPLSMFPQETVTEGLDGLRARAADYRDMGARFAKWRATITIGEGLPTDAAILANVHAMARYAAICQEADLVPILEPEVLTDGEHHIDLCASASVRTWHALYAQLAEYRVHLPATLLKVNMVLCGDRCPNQAGTKEIAEVTLRSLGANVPAEVPGVLFLSGGMSEEDATIRLNEMNKASGHPWELSFSYGRALQQAALKAWAGDPTNVELAQRAFRHRARMNGLARSGEYSSDLE